IIYRRICVHICHFRQHLHFSLEAGWKSVIYPGMPTKILRPASWYMAKCISNYLAVLLRGTSECRFLRATVMTRGFMLMSRMSCTTVRYHFFIEKACGYTVISNGKILLLQYVSG